MKTTKEPPEIGNSVHLFFNRFKCLNVYKKELTLASDRLLTSVSGVVVWLANVRCLLLVHL